MFIFKISHSIQILYILFIILIISLAYYSINSCAYQLYKRTNNESFTNETSIHLDIPIYSKPLYTQNELDNIYSKPNYMSYNGFKVDLW